MTRSANKYRRWYDALMAKARARNSLNGYSERHHIKPKSLGGSDVRTNIVRLTYREHYLAHWMLTKFKRGEARRKMSHALWRLSGSRGERIVAGWQYEVARRAQRDAMSTPKAKADMAAISVAMWHNPKIRARMLAAQIGRKCSVETRALLSAKQRAAWSAERHLAMSKLLAGRKLRPETIEKMRAADRAPDGVHANILKGIARKQGATKKELVVLLMTKFPGRNPSEHTVLSQTHKHATSKRYCPARGIVYHLRPNETRRHTFIVGGTADNTRKLIARTQGATIKELINAFAQKFRGNKPSLIAIRKQVRRHSTSKQRHPMRGLVYYMATPKAA